MRHFFSAYRWQLALVIVLLVATVFYSVSYLKRVSAAYLYGYPLVLMSLTKETMLAEGGAQLNTFNHIQDFPDHSFRNVVRPNVDTLYSIAWLDLSTGPIVLNVPDMGDRYYVMPLMDAWTNVFAMVGKRTHGTQAGRFLIAGPDWQGEVPENVELIPAPSNMVWIIGRIQTKGKQDIPAVAGLQKGFRLEPLESSLMASVPQPYSLATFSDHNKKDLATRLNEMPNIAFLAAMAELMAEQYPAAADADMIRSLEKIGVKPGQSVDASQYNFIQRRLIDLAVTMTKEKVAEELASDRAIENGWSVIRDGIGVYHTNYPLRAGVSMVGLGALPPEEASYPNAISDSSKRALSGEHSYVIHFEPGQTPPVDAFWSLTMYDQHGFLVDNPIQRYAIGDRDDLHFNADGSLDILIQKAPPSGVNVNWLPSPAEQFALTMRLYSPRAEFLNGSWQLPPVTRIPLPVN
ncbi:DUF1254 domain-containing protein [Zhongshania sp.]|jgi:hypothetical protein|uniref:DUF1254 domain-containing protein n=1 Tax=Zhongshania sp. TaxID=1971902 RepID=UPI0039E5F7E7